MACRNTRAYSSCRQPFILIGKFFQKIVVYGRFELAMNKSAQFADIGEIRHIKILDFYFIFFALHMYSKFMLLIEIKYFLTLNTQVEFL